MDWRIQMWGQNFSFLKTQALGPVFKFQVLFCRLIILNLRNLTICISYLDSVMKVLKRTSFWKNIIFSLNFSLELITKTTRWKKSTNFDYFLIYRTFEIYFLGVSWVAVFKYRINIFDLKPSSILEEFFNYSSSILDLLSSIRQKNYLRFRFCDSAMQKFQRTSFSLHPFHFYFFIM